MPNRSTFKIKPIRELLKDEIGGGLWIDPFAASTRYATITNDLNPTFDTDYHLDALDFVGIFRDGEVDGGVIYDPPYSVRQVSECYKGLGLKVTGATTRSDWWTRYKKEIARVMAPQAKVISFGWNSNGIGKTNGFEMTRILIVAHGGAHNDTICVVEVKNGGN